VYFALVLAASTYPQATFDAYLPRGWSAYIPYVASVLFQVSLGVAVLISGIVTWVLYPAAVRKNAASVICDATLAIPSSQLTALASEQQQQLFKLAVKVLDLCSQSLPATHPIRPQSADEQSILLSHRQQAESAAVSPQGQALAMRAYIVAVRNRLLNQDLTAVPAPANKCAHYLLHAFCQHALAPPVGSACAQVCHCTTTCRVHDPLLSRACACEGWV
jgi:hypothetical protein